MKKQASHILTIPNPCHENWAEMTPVEQGRYCAACQKTVIDFTVLSDQQIINIISTTPSGCGYFFNSQLNRELLPTLKQRSLFSSGSIEKLVASLLFFQSIAYNAWAAPTVSIRGKVYNNKKQPIAHARVQIAQAGISIGESVTDSNGYYNIQLMGQEHYDINVSHIGYKSSSAGNIIAANDHTAQVDFTLEEGKDIIITKEDIDKAASRNTNTFVQIASAGGWGYGGHDRQPIWLPHVKRTFWQKINIFKRKKS